MRAAGWITCLWPGLSRLWFRGEVLGLLTATAFASLLNLLLVATFIWPELVHPVVWYAGWLIVTVFWCCGFWRSVRRWPELTGRALAGAGEDLFIQAQAEYLKGHWFEAETLLRQLLRHCNRDVDVLLMLATLYRRTGRLDEAEKQLDRMDRLDEARKWRWEIAQERETLKQRAASKSNAAPKANTETTETDPGTDTSNEELGTRVPQT